MQHEQKLTLVEQIDSILPQSQCEKCDYPGCLPYAKAIVEKGAPINQCAPGGQITTDAIAKIIDSTTIPVRAEASNRAVAVIKEDLCVGCTICLRYCPTDAIFGARKQMHTVISDDCTGCELCIEPCPMDCIELVERIEDKTPWTIDNPQMQEFATHAKSKYINRQARLERGLAKKQEIQAQQNKQLTPSIKDEILNSVARAKAKKQARLAALKKRSSN